MSGPRPVRAPRGTELSALGWQQEAALRMLQNNLDPEVAEHPDKLVVYGGTGKAARDWRSFDAMVRTLRDPQAGRDDARPVRPPGRRHADPRVGAARPHRQLQPGRRLGQLGGVPPPGGPRPHHVRPDDRRLVDLHRHPGHPPGHLRDLRRRRREEVRRHPRRDHHPHRRSRRHGRRPAARRHHERRRRDLHRRRPARHRAPHRAPLPRRAGRHPRARPPAGRRGPRRSAGRCPSACSATRPSCCRSCSPRARPIDIVTDQTSAHDPLAYLPAGVDFDDMAAYAAAKDPPSFTTRARESMARHVEAMVGFMDAGAEVFDYGNSIRGEAQLAGYDRAFAFPGFVPAYIRPLFCEGKGPFRWAALSGEASRHRTRPTRRSSTSSRRTSRCTAGSSWPASASTSRACPPASAGSATASATRPASASTTWSPTANLARPARHRPRPPRLRLRRLPLPGDRGHARRLRRDRRLAAAQRHGQRRLRRLLGLHPPRRRRRHGPLHPRRARSPSPTAPRWPARRSAAC